MMSVFFLFFFCNPYKHTHADRFQTSDFESQNNIFHKANKFCWLWIEYVAVKWTKWLKIQFVQRTSFRRIADQSLSFPSAMILIYIFRLKKPVTYRYLSKDHQFVFKKKIKIEKIQMVLLFALRNNPSAILLPNISFPLSNWLLLWLCW